MALPPNSETERGVYLRNVFYNTHPTEVFSTWPKLIVEDYAVVGRLINLYSFIEINLRRLVESWTDADLLPKGRIKDLPLGRVEELAQTVLLWPEANLFALKKMAELRSLRNLVAHFGMMRFPDDDAFLFIAKSEADYKKQTGEQSVEDVMLIAVLDGPALPRLVQELEGMAQWLATVTAQILKQKADAEADVSKS
ncbi:hypothetical protein ABIB90_003162 [Bradyrhizobium sp. JR4.1]|uniref:hypothetical protein n=1 Tax=Bradyrhizobium sp. JR4.1 TaxID=3156372 RepID=UPI003391CF8D